MGNIIAGIVVLLITGLAIYFSIKNKGCDCSSCNGGCKCSCNNENSDIE